MLVPASKELSAEETLPVPVSAGAAAETGPETEDVAMLLMTIVPFTEETLTFSSGSAAAAEPEDEDWPADEADEAVLCRPLPHPAAESDRVSASSAGRNL